MVGAPLITTLWYDIYVQPRMITQTMWNGNMLFKVFEEEWILYGDELGPVIEHTGVDDASGVHVELPSFWSFP